MGRTRRPAAETKAAMIEAAQELLVVHGPAGVKLDDVAAEVGVSRQAVLHHFGNRDGLLRAVVERAWLGLFAELQGLQDPESMSPSHFLDQIDQTVRVRGNARLGAWLLLSETGLPAEVFRGALADLPGKIKRAFPELSDDDAQYGLILVATTLFGDAIFGGRIREAIGAPDGEDARAGYRAWLVARLG